MVSVFEYSLAFKKRLRGIYLFRFSTYFRQHAMVFTSDSKAIIKNDYKGKGWTAYRIYKELKSKEWVEFCSTPLSSRDCNTLDYYFWNKVREKAYENRLDKPFENKRELKKRIASVWKDIAFNLPKIRKAIKQSTGGLKRRRKLMYQNDLWLRFIRTLIFFVQFQVFDTVICNF